jgi:putative nucleotidyltransferase with HDIG domain
LTGVVSGLATFAGFMAVESLGGGQALRESFGAAAGGFVSASLVLTLGPAAEWVFGHTTRLSMSEWLNYEHPLLRALASAAPGTFQHSINVGVLAHSAASEIGADALLARVAGLYHDVGKMRAPEYFIENQHGANPHDQLHPWDSAVILRANVSDGVAFLAAHRMGTRLADFVREHHGTGRMRLLQERAASLDPSDGHQETYQYSGPRPRSRETAILMIADQVEATARSAPPADDAACDEIIRRTIARIRDEHELDDAGVSERDLGRIHRGLSRALQAMFHRRLPYPAAGTPGQPGPRSRFGMSFGRRRAGA